MKEKTEKDYRKIVNDIKKKINSFSCDFDSTSDFMRDVIEIIYGKHKSKNASKFLYEFYSDYENACKDLI